MKVELEPGVWLADGDGDPPRTLVERNAKEFPTEHAAYAALNEARVYRAFPDAMIVDDFI